MKIPPKGAEWQLNINEEYNIWLQHTADNQKLHQELVGSKSKIEKLQNENTNLKKDIETMKNHDLKSREDMSSLRKENQNLKGIANENNIYTTTSNISTSR